MCGSILSYIIQMLDDIPPIQVIINKCFNCRKGVWKRSPCVMRFLEVLHMRTHQHEVL